MNSQGNNTELLPGKDKVIWRRREGTQGFNTQGRRRQLDTGETHLREKTRQDIGNRIQTKRPNTTEKYRKTLTDRHLKAP